MLGPAGAMEMEHCPHPPFRRGIWYLVDVDVGGEVLAPGRGRGGCGADHGLCYCLAIPAGQQQKHYYCFIIEPGIVIRSRDYHSYKT